MFEWPHSVSGHNFFCWVRYERYVLMRAILVAHSEGWDPFKSSFMRTFMGACVYNNCLY